jgi:hypothetical protein
MVRTRATTSGANNPCHETGGGSHQNATEMEARLAQMSRDMEVLTQQNLRLLRRLADERIPEVAEGNEEETKEQRKQPAIKKLGAYATSTASNEVGTKLEERELETDSP